MNKLQLLDKKIKSSNLKITKNILYYAIAPVVILLIGIILLCTVGFNGGTNIYGGSTLTVYINNEAKITSENAQQYDINDDYNEICHKIKVALSDGNLKAEDFFKTRVDIEGLVAGGDAVKVVYFNSSSDADKIEQENIAIVSRLQAEFGYTENPEAISQADRFEGEKSLSWALILTASIIFAATIALIYLALRTKSVSWILGIAHVALDLIITISLILIFRLSITYALATTMIFTSIASLINIYTFFGKAKSDIANEKYSNEKTSAIADINAKELGFKKCMIYVIMLIIALVLVVMPVGALREIALGLILSLITTFYTSNFILPSIWMLSYKPSKRQIKNKEAL